MIIKRHFNNLYWKTKKNTLKIILFFIMKNLFGILIIKKNILRV